MTEKRLQEIMRHYHQPQAGIFMVSQPIGANVRYALVWDAPDHLHGNAPYKVYLIFNDVQVVGAVLDMVGDLHWFIETTERKKGHLTRALQNAILPHLARVRKSQQISITRSEIGDDNFRASLAVARACKFRVKGGMSDKLICSQSLQKYRAQPLAVLPEGMDFEAIAGLSKRMNHIVAELWQIQGTIQMGLGDSRYSHELMKTVNLLERYRIVRLEDALYDYLDHNPGHRS